MAKNKGHRSKGDGGLTEVIPGKKYIIKTSIGKDTSGKYKFHKETVNGTARQAVRRIREIQHQLDSGAFIKPNRLTLKEYLEKWLADYVSTRLSPRSLERYSGIVHNYLIPEMGRLTLAQLKPEHIQAHYGAMLKKGLTPQSVRYHHAVIHKALQTAVKWELTKRNVADAVEPPKKVRTEMQYWTLEEVNRFLDSVQGSEYYGVFHTALFTGMRRGELLGLKWSDVDLIASEITVKRSLHHLKDGRYIFTQPKTESSNRVIALALSSRKMLIDLYEKRKLICIELGTALKDDDLVFCHIDGRPLRPNTITRVWKELAIKAGLKPIRLHDARHTHASLMLKDGIHPKIVQERLGHSSITTTLDIYSHVSKGIQQAAAESFDRLLNSGRVEIGANANY